MAGYGGNRDGGLGQMIGGLREPEEERSGFKGQVPPKKRKPKKENPHAGKSGKGRRGFDPDSFDN